MPLGLRREIAGADDEVDEGREAGFAVVKELLVRAEGAIRAGAAQAASAVVGHQVFDDRNRLAHRDVVTSTTSTFASPATRGPWHEMWSWLYRWNIQQRGE